MISLSTCGRRWITGSSNASRSCSFLVLILGAGVLFAPVSSLGQKLRALDADVAAGDQFGFSAAIEGMHVLIGSPYANDFGGFSGGVSFFRPDTAGWSDAGRLQAAEVTAEDQFGYDVALDGNRAIVGAYTGAAYIFEWTDSTWLEQDQLTVESGGQQDEFGSTVDISGEYAIVGAHRQTVADTINTAGAAYVFVRDTSGWVQDTMLTASEPAAGDHFGYSVALDGAYAVIGAWGDDTDASDAGAAYIFHRSNGTWTQQSLLTAAEGTEGDEFGFSVALSGERALIGAWKSDLEAVDAGAAFSFLHGSSGWEQEQIWTSGDTTAAEAGYGYSVAIDSNTAAVGSVRDDGWVSQSGAAYIYEYEAEAWHESQKIMPDSVETGALLGAAVAVDMQSGAVIGARGSDGTAQDGGAAWFYGSAPKSPVAVREPDLPHTTSLAPNYPNPFNPTTTIPYRVMATSRVRLRIYDALGRLVATPVDRVQTPGRYRIQWHAGSHPSGVYFYRLTADDQRQTRTMILLR